MITLIWNFNLYQISAILQVFTGWSRFMQAVSQESKVITLKCSAEVKEVIRPILAWFCHYGVIDVSPYFVNKENQWPVTFRNPEEHVLPLPRKVCQLINIPLKLLGKCQLCARLAWSRHEQKVWSGRHCKRCLLWDSMTLSLFLCTLITLSQFRRSPTHQVVCVGVSVCLWWQDRTLMTLWPLTPAVWPVWWSRRWMCSDPCLPSLSSLSHPSLCLPPSLLWLFCCCLT